MKFHTQEHIVIRNESGEIIQNGSCYPTAYACILDLELHEVPYFHLMYWNIESKKNIATHFQNKYLKGNHISSEGLEDYQKENFSSNTSYAANLWDNVREIWLASKGYREVYIKDISEWLKENVDVPYFASGKSTRGVDHIVIYMNGKLLHDPHPSRDGLVELWENAFSFLEKNSTLSM